jgi:RimJ/RimL family protein N-acetyltransferase
MSNYRCLSKQEYHYGVFKLIPLREEDMELIRIWRNEQMYHLRQNAELTVQHQKKYFDDIILALFEQDKPNQILFSFFEKEVFVGYGGLVHVNWSDKNAEISFLINTLLEVHHFEKYWSNYLKLIEEVAFNEIFFRKIYTYSYELRPRLYPILEQHNYLEEARLKEHCYFEGAYIDVLIHSKWNGLSLRKAIDSDMELYFDWTNDEQTRKNSFSSEKIEYKNHRDWFVNKVRDPNTLMFVFQNDTHQPIGQVRIEKKNNENLIGISIDKNHRGKGYGSKIIKMAAHEFFDKTGESILLANIKPENIASRKIFSNSGFVEIIENETLVCFKLTNK